MEGSPYLIKLSDPEREELELAIADNLAYVANVLAQLRAPRQLVFIGFSQGATMTSRAAAHIPCAALILLGGDCPPR